MLLAWRFRSSDYQAQQRLVITMVLYTITAVTSHKLVRVNRFVISVTLALMKLGLLWRTFCIDDLATLYSLYSYRQIVRFGIATAELNHRRTGLFAVLTCAAQCYSSLRLAVLHVPLVVAGEVFNVMATWGFFYLIEKWLSERVAAVIEAREASFEKMASSRLLSVFSDAEAFLSSDLQIMRPAKRLSGLLIANSDLDGKPFQNLLDEADKLRFANFIRASLTALPTVPVNSLQVSLRDSYGLPLKVELFHVHMANEPGVPAHLIGISCLEEREPLADFGGAAQQLMPTLCEDGSSGSEASSSSSGSCSKSNFEKTFETLKLQSEDFPDIEQIEVSFEPTGNFAVHELTVTCHLPEEGASCKATQALRTWMMPESWNRFALEVPDLVNDWCASKCSSRSRVFTNLQLKIPRLLSKHQILIAESATLQRASADEDMDNPEDEEEEEGVALPILTLERIRLQKRKKTPSSVKSLPKIDEITRGHGPPHHGQHGQQRRDIDIQSRQGTT
eukprot:TRINITY_DN23977_c0_g1_i5.p1 TRINITY_DN23977_c0_g1~~TRINITY_DN23977_c0_g1_i5.p1  ORF type:complete len:506 (+),score=80.61 TRINITY_DN23977_c0_g1_i5:3-1520(+)